MGIEYVSHMAQRQYVNHASFPVTIGKLTQTRCGNFSSFIGMGALMDSMDEKEHEASNLSPRNPWPIATAITSEAHADSHAIDPPNPEGQTDWGRAPHPGENKLYDQIYQEVNAFALDGKSANPSLEKLHAKYRAIRVHGPGDRWDKSYEYLGLSHLINEGVFLPNSKAGDSKSRAPQFSKWAGEDIEGPFPFGKEDGFRLLHFLWNQAGWGPFNELTSRVAEIPNAYYFALVNALESGYSTQESLGRAAPGIYQFYRKSTLMPNLYLVGILGVMMHGEAIRTFEVHRLPGYLGSAETGELLKKTPTVFEVYEGWMVKKSRQILIHAFDCVTHAFQLSVISNVLQSPTEPLTTKRPTKENSKFQLMSGMATGVDGQLGFYSVPAVYTRLGDFDSLRHDGSIAPGSKHLADIVLEAMSTSAASSDAFNALGVVQASELPDFVRMQLETATSAMCSKVVTA